MDTSGRKKGLRSAVIAGAMCMFGCFSYKAVVSLQPPSIESQRVSSADVGRAVSAVRRSIEPLGMIVDPRLQRIARDSRESASIDNEVVDLLTTGPEMSEFVEVRSVIEKETGQFRVIIQDHELPTASQLTKELQSAIVAALREEFPASTVLLDTGTTGPSLGP